MLTDTLAQANGSPVAGIMDDGFGNGHQWIDLQLHPSLEDEGNIRSIFLVFDLDSPVTPDVEVQAFQEDEVIADEGVSYDAEILENKLWIKVFRSNGNLLETSIRLRVDMTNLGSNPSPVAMALMDGIVIVDNINGLTKPDIGPIKDLTNAAAWFQYYANNSSIMEDENARMGATMTLFPNPVHDYCELTAIPSFGTQLFIYNSNWELQLTQEVGGFSSLNLDLSLLEAGRYFLVVAGEDGSTAIRFVKE